MLISVYILCVLKYGQVGGTYIKLALLFQNRKKESSKVKKARIYKLEE